MKQILTFIAALFVCAPLFAGARGVDTSQNGSVYSVTCSTYSGTLLFSDTNIESVIYDNQTAGPIGISTYAATAIQQGAVYIIPTGRTVPMRIDSTAFKYGISSTTANTQLRVIVVK